MKAATKKRLLRYALVAVSALAVAQGIRVYQASSREVQLVYFAPAGPLTVELRDEDGTRLRRTEFAADGIRQHELELPDGTYSAIMRVPERRPTTVPFLIEGDGVFQVKWPARATR